MAYATGDVYSPYEVDQLAIKVAGESEYTRDDCIGTLTVERETKTITKSCRGVVKKRKTKPTGNGSITMKMHTRMIATDALPISDTTYSMHPASRTMVTV